VLAGSTNTAIRCPAYLGQNTAKYVESLLTQIHFCRDCHQTFIIDKPQQP
jgi:hypothetical protein